MSATEDRAARLAIAKELADELRRVRVRVDAIINHMLSDADSLKIAAADEVSRGDVPTVKKVRFGKPAGELVASLDATPQVMAAIPQIIDALKKVRRACSICRQPGHWAKNCPNAHLVQAEKKAAVDAREAAKKPKRKMPPLTPEQKAKRVESLKKARAAKAK